MFYSCFYKHIQLQFLLKISGISKVLNLTRLNGYKSNFVKTLTTGFGRTLVIIKIKTVLKWFSSVITRIIVCYIKYLSLSMYTAECFGRRL